MAISQELWNKAKILFESGKLSLSEISSKTGIEKSSISKKAKIQQWKSGIESEYIDAKVLIAEKNSTLAIEKINILEDVANDEIRRRKLVFGLTEKILNNINKTISTTIPILDDKGKKIKDEEIALDSKSAKEYIEAIDKASITLGINQRHSNNQVTIQNNNANSIQNNTDTLTLQQAEEEALKLGVPLDVLVNG